MRCLHSHQIPVFASIGQPTFLSLDTHKSIKALVEEKRYSVEQAEKIVYFLLGDDSIEF